MPYNRGALYFADLDARIRAKSKGQRKLDDFLRPMFVSREKGVRFDHDAWMAMLTRELGKSAAEEFPRVILQGEMLTPAKNAFGPCFERRPKTYDVAGTAVSGYEWVRIAGIPENTCRAW
ncbi:hypothetical protein ACFPN2_24965 [Steroidobacter flavus]|uniref:Uncharacterized protein n=1 Tax=Steroidobacter flavus TaxID=1842136 RepID=A0ABV8SXK3_9GAMM